MNEPTETTHVPDMNVGDVFSKSANVVCASVRELHSENANLEQSAAKNITATDLTVHQSALLQASVTSLNASASVVGYVQTTNAVLTAGSRPIVVVAESEVTMDHAPAQVLLAQDVKEATYSPMGMVVANRVVVRDSKCSIGVLIAGNVEGNVSPQLDTRGAIIAGAVAGAVLLS
jgi:hypothetical protein